MISTKPMLFGREWDLFFLLPPNAKAIWLFHYRCEYDERESYPGEETMCRMLRIHRDTLATQRAWLKRYGWLVQTSAAYRGHNPTYRVERGYIPDCGCYNHETPDPKCEICHRNEQKRQEVAQRNNSYALEMDTQNSDALRKDRKKSVGKIPTPRFEVEGSGSNCFPLQVGVGVLLSSPSEQPLPAGEKQEGNLKPENPKTNTNPSGIGSKNTRTGKDGTPYPEGFDSWSVADKLRWSEQHNKVGTLLPNQKATPTANEVVVTGDCDGFNDFCGDPATIVKGAYRYCDRCYSAKLKYEGDNL